MELYQREDVLLQFGADSAGMERTRNEDVRVGFGEVVGDDDVPQFALAVEMPGLDSPSQTTGRKTKFIEPTMERGSFPISLSRRRALVRPAARQIRWSRPAQICVPTRRY
jgi:hypothetical protein